MSANLLQKALKAAEKGQSYAFATIIESTLKGTPQKSGAKMVVLADGSLFGTIGGGRNEKAAREQCLKAMKTGKPVTVRYDFFGGKDQSVCGGQIKVFIEPFVGYRHFVICGAGHIALPLSAYAKTLNYKVTIIDNRRAYANKKRFPHVDTILVGEHTKKLATLKIDPSTYIMIVTQGNEFDYQCLKAVVKSTAGYIGVISSKAKRIKFLNRLKKEKVPAKFIKRVKIPAGIDLGGQTPEEIAISIVSEVIQTDRKNFLDTAKFKERAKR